MSGRYLVTCQPEKFIFDDSYFVLDDWGYISEWLITYNGKAWRRNIYMPEDMEWDSLLPLAEWEYEDEGWPVVYDRSV